MTSPQRTNPRRPASSKPPTETPTETPTMTADLPAFQSLPAPNPPAESPSPEPASVSAGAGPDVPVPPSTAASSTQGSTDSQGKSSPSKSGVVVAPADPALYIELGGVAFAGIGLLLHQRLTPGEDNDAWIPDEQDHAAVVTPLASIAARRSPLVGGAASDVTDGLAALIGAVGYAVKSMQKWRECRRQRKQTSGWQGQADAGGAPAAAGDVDQAGGAEPHVVFDPAASPLAGFGTHLGEGL